MIRSNKRVVLVVELIDDTDVINTLIANFMRLNELTINHVRLK